MKFRQVSLRGLQKVDLEWMMAALSYNLKRTLSRKQMDKRLQSAREPPGGA